MKSLLSKVFTLKPLSLGLCGAEKQTLRAAIDSHLWS